MPGASAHCCGMARFINRPHVATFMFIWPGRKKFLPINRKFDVFICFVLFDSLHPINNLSVKQEWVFLG